MIERMLADFDAAHGLRYAALRYFNAAGADPDGDIGEQHDPETHLIPLAIAAALGTREDFSLFGTDYDTPDGTCVRDFIHVADLADAHVLAVKALLNGCTSTAYNLGTGAGHSVQEVLDSVARTAGRSFPIRRSRRRPGDPPRLVADPSKVIRDLKWRARYTELDEIVRTAWEWHESRMR
jgi:UDP-arabinose 4-epimerase